MFFIMSECCLDRVTLHHAGWRRRRTRLAVPWLCSGQVEMDTVEEAAGKLEKPRSSAGSDLVDLGASEKGITSCMPSRAAFVAITRHGRSFLSLQLHQRQHHRDSKHGRLRLVPVLSSIHRRRNARPVRPRQGPQGDASEEEEEGPQEEEERHHSLLLRPALARPQEASGFTAARICPRGQSRHCCTSSSRQSRPIASPSPSPHPRRPCPFPANLCASQFIVMFRSRFSDAFPPKCPHFGPQDLERGVSDPVPAPQVEGLLCALLGLVLNRKKPVE